MATTINATRSYEDYEKEQIDKAMAQVNQQAAAYKQNSDQTLSQIGAAIDKSANTAAGVYQQRIDGADALYKNQYADNAIDEAFARNQIKNSMAASGMTDSGQNLTMQTALSLQRNNRDATVTENKRNYVKEMQDAIDAVWADAASQKATREITAQQNYQTFYDNLYANAMSGARENAVNLYNADLAAQQAAYEAEQQSAAEQAKAKAEAEAGNSSDMLEAINKYADKLIEAGEDEQSAWEIAKAKIGAVFGYMTDEEANQAIRNVENAKVSAESSTKKEKLSKAKSIINGQNVLGGRYGGWDWWDTKLFRTDKGEVSQTIKEVTKEVEKFSAYQKGDQDTKDYLIAYALAVTLSYSRGSKQERDILLPYLKKQLTEEQYEIVKEEYNPKS